MSPEFIVTLFILIALTIPAAIGSVIVFRGTYYKSLPGKVEALEKELLHKEGIVERQTQEILLLKDMVIGKAELKEIIGILQRHDAEAERRHETSVRLCDRQHAEILGNILDIKAAQKRREIQDGK